MANAVQARSGGPSIRGGVCRHCDAMSSSDEDAEPTAPPCGVLRAQPDPGTEPFEPKQWGGRSLADGGPGGSGASWSIPRPIRDLGTAADLLRARYGVGRVYQAGLSDQAARLQNFLPSAARTAAAVAADFGALLRTVGWRAWCPANDAPAWLWLWRSFELFESVFGIIPKIDEVGFFHVHYRVQAAEARVELLPSDETLALFGGGSMAIYRNAEQYAGGKPLPGARSTAAREAPLFALSPADGFAFFIVHELAHGLVERSRGGLERLEEFRIFAGWAADGRLYDAGSREVELIGGQTKTPAGRRITMSSWNAPWEEQPITQYSTAHAVEDFAESAAAYALCPKLLEARAPRRYAFFEQTFPR